MLWLPDELLVAIFGRCDPDAQLMSVPHVCQRWRRVSVSSVRTIDLTFHDLCFYGICAITPAAYRRVINTFPGATTIRVCGAALLCVVTPAVVELSLSACIAMCDEVVGHISARCPNLHTVNIDCAVNVTLAALRVLCARCELLADVSLGGCHWVDDNALAALNGCPNLTRLCLNGTAVTPHGVGLLATLTRLEIDGCAHIHAATLPALPALTHLRTRSCYLHPFNTSAALHVAAQCPAIVGIDLRGPFAVPVDALLHLLHQCVGLKHLGAHVACTTNMPHRPLSARHHLRSASPLTHLTCSGLSDDTFGLLVNNCPRLTHVDIAGSNVQTAKMLARPHLRHLCLDNTRVGDDTILALAKHATSLETVSWRSALEVYPSGLAFAVLLALPALRHVKFSVCANTARLQRAINRARRRSVHVERHWIRFEPW